MPFLVNPCKCSIFNPSIPLFNSVIYSSNTQFPVLPTSLKAKTPIPHCGSSTNPVFSSSSSVWRLVQSPLCSKKETDEEFRSSHLSAKCKNEGLELLNKPSPNKPIGDQSDTETEEEEEDDEKKPNKDVILEPFLKFFTPRESQDEKSEVGIKDEVIQEAKEVNVEYFEPKLGDFVVGVVVSGNDRKLDVNIGADLLGVLLTKDVLPLHGKEMRNLLFDFEKDAEEVMVGGKVGIVKNDEAVSGESMPGRPVVDHGTVLFAEVLGRTLSGRPLLSSRRLFRRIAWHRVRQIKHLNVPIEVKITEWNTSGLLTRIEGLRAFIPKAELVNRVNSFTELKENLGRRIHVLITKINEETNSLVLTEREAWNMLNLQEGTLLEGTVLKIFPYGAQIRIGKTNRSGLLHISKISKGQITSVGDLLAVNEKVKVLVVKSMFPDKISLSIVDLESEPGLFLSNKEKVFSEAEKMAKKYRQSIPGASVTRKREPLPISNHPFEDPERMYANWEWFIFEKDNESTS